MTSPFVKTLTTQLKWFSTFHIHPSTYIHLIIHIDSINFTRGLNKKFQISNGYYFFFGRTRMSLCYDGFVMWKISKMINNPDNSRAQKNVGKINRNYWECIVPFQLRTAKHNSNLKKNQDNNKHRTRYRCKCNVLVL